MTGASRMRRDSVQFEDESRVWAQAMDDTTRSAIHPGLDQMHRQWEDHCRGPLVGGLAQSLQISPRSPPRPAIPSRFRAPTEHVALARPKKKLPKRWWAVTPGYDVARACTNNSIHWARRRSMAISLRL